MDNFMKLLLCRISFLMILVFSTTFAEENSSTNSNFKTEIVDLENKSINKKKRFNFIFSINGLFKQGYREFYYNSIESVPPFFAKGISGGFGLQVNKNLIFLTGGFSIDKGTVTGQFNNTYNFRQYNWSILASYYRSIKIERVKHLNLNIGFKAGGLIDETTIYDRYQYGDDILDGHGHFGGPSIGLTFSLLNFMYTYLLSEDFLGGSMIEVGLLIKKKNR